MLLDCLTQFNMRGKAVGDAGKMENVLSCLSSYNMEVPVAFQICFFREKTQDLLRFRKVDDFISFCSMKGGYMSDMDSSLRSDLDAIALDSMDEALGTFLKVLIASSGQLKAEAIAELADLATKLADEELGFLPSLHEEMRLMATVISIGDSSATMQERQDAKAKLNDKLCADDYVGVLRTISKSEHWASLLAVVDGPAAKKQDLYTCTYTIYVLFTYCMLHTVTYMLHVYILQDVFKNLSAAVEKCNLLVYTETDKHELHRCLRKAIQAYAKSSGKKDVREKLGKLMAALKMKSELGVQACTEELAKLVHLLLEGPSSLEPGAGLATCRQCDMHIVAAKDVCLKSCLDLAGELAKVFAVAADGADEDGFLKTHAEQLQEDFIQVDHIVKTMELLVKINVATMRKCPATDSQTAALSDIVNFFTELKALMKKAKLPDTISLEIAKYESTFDIRAHGTAAYKEQLMKFKQGVKTLASGVLSMAADMSRGKYEVEEGAMLMSDSVHQLRQVLGWSNTPEYDSGCVDFAMDLLLVIGKGAEKAVQLGLCVPANYLPDMELATALAMTCGQEASVTKLSWLLGEELSSDFLLMAKRMKDTTGPLNSEYKASEEAKFLALAEKLQGAMADDQLPDAEFRKSLTIAKLNTMQKNRTAAKAHLDNIVKFCGGQIDMVSEAVKEKHGITQKAKHQIVKWGLLAFLLKPEIESLSTSGKQLRDQLASVWLVNFKDAQVLEYLGDDMVQKLRNLTDKHFGATAKAASESGAGLTPAVADEPPAKKRSASPMKGRLQRAKSQIFS